MDIHDSNTEVWETFWAENLDPQTVESVISTLSGYAEPRRYVDSVTFSVEPWDGYEYQISFTVIDLSSYSCVVGKRGEYDEIVMDGHVDVDRIPDGYDQYLVSYDHQTSLSLVFPTITAAFQEISQKHERICASFHRANMATSYDDLLDAIIHGADVSQRDYDEGMSGYMPVRQWPG